MPAPLEEKLKLSPYIDNVDVRTATNRPYNVALVVPNREAVRVWASGQGIEVADLARDQRVVQFLTQEVRRSSGSFRSFEVPRRILLSSEDFTTENDLLTPTLKLKRRNVESRHGAALEALYAADADADMELPSGRA